MPCWRPPCAFSLRTFFLSPHQVSLAFCRRLTSPAPSLHWEEMMSKGVRKRRDTIWNGKLALAPAPISSSKSRASAVTVLCYLAQGGQPQSKGPVEHLQRPLGSWGSTPNCYSHDCFTDCKMNIYSLKKALKVLKVKNIFRLSIIPLHRDINNWLSFHLLLMLIKGIFFKRWKGQEVYFLY